MIKRAVEFNQDGIDIRQQVLPKRELYLFPNQYLDQRLAERLTLALPISYTLRLPYESISGSTSTLNISGGGIQFLIPSMVSPQTACYLNLTLPEHSKPLVFLGYVSWCRQGRGKHKEQFEVGVIFSLPESCDESTFTRYCHFIATQLLVKYLK